MNEEKKKKRILIEWKARDLKHRHAWIVDRKGDKESKICDPEDVTGYIDPKRVGYRPLVKGEDCKKCLMLWPKIIEQFGLENLDIIRMKGEVLDYNQINRKRG